MAVPEALFSNRSGIALMRQTNGEWFFECWADRSAKVVTLLPGSHAFQLWLVAGRFGPVETIVYNDTSTITAIVMKK